ncbi:MAG TPA: sulfite exporter TauE/SafE family protein [Candidatus Dormibacteraeota bacterium]|nr:sulfite exporter TauE/SafE family protein [Candidatus Dormibacteraeota bacterium]
MLEVLIGFFGGILIGATGAGAGLLISPLLILAGYRPAVAVGTGLGVLVASKLVGSVAHYRLGHWPGGRAWQLLAGGAGGVVLTWMLAKIFFPHPSVAMDFWVRRSMACALLALPLFFFISARKGRGSSGHPGTSPEPERHSPTAPVLVSAGQPAALFAVGMAVGAPVLVTSLGSGSILAPALLLVTDWEVPQLAAVSNWFGLVVGVLSVAAHLQMGNLQVGSFGKLGLGIVPGVALGAWLSRKIPRASFVYGMSAAALFLGARLLFG